MDGPVRIKPVNLEQCLAQSNAPFLHLLMFFSPLKSYLRYLKRVTVIIPHS